MSDCSDQTPPESSATGTRRPADPPGDHRAEPAVDAVVRRASLDGPRRRVPLAEHVAVFEAAHDRLRAALADAGN